MPHFRSQPRFGKQWVRGTLPISQPTLGAVLGQRGWGLLSPSGLIIMVWNFSRLTLRTQYNRCYGGGASKGTFRSLITKRSLDD